jgi:hypothetical protein
MLIVNIEDALLKSKMFSAEYLQYEQGVSNRKA